MSVKDNIIKSIKYLDCRYLCSYNNFPNILDYPDFIVGGTSTSYMFYHNTTTTTVQNVTFDESALSLVAERGFNKKSGAREARRESARLIEDSFAEEFLRGRFQKGDKLICFAEDGKILYGKE